ncbi:hypothetical protein [Paenibacillus sp. A3]|uniref:hypothetical protein n=1 Tax=Paenibacillus sp. A3 TaxID=1337054 RepID=UPI000B23AF00|nr:hypothetical protein [Paenibacillus sp. A3]
MSINFGGFKQKGKGLVLASLSAFTLLAGCSAGAGGGANSAAPAKNETAAAPSGGTTEIAFYFSGSQNVQELWKHLKDMYEKKQDKVKVKLVLFRPDKANRRP